MDRRSEPPAGDRDLADATTFRDVLRARAALHPDRPAFTFLADGETPTAVLTFGELDRQARAIGGFLQRAGAAGERALLLYPPGLEFVSAFFGCLYAGVVAVPAYPPDPTRLARSVPRLQGIVADAGATVALTTGPLLAAADAVFAHAPALRHLRWLATDAAAAAEPADAWRPAAAGPPVVALQYTSGSTATPKGVMLTDANLLAHVRTVLAMYRERTDWSTAVSWFPQFHDAGLIGFTLLPLYAGVHTVTMSPLAFLQRPARWLEAITRWRAEISGGPNFAYDFCVRRVGVAERERLDLRSWAAACNGAEPIRAATLDRFAAAFEPVGFRRTAFYPCWGLAEATLVVSANTRSKPPLLRSVRRAELAAGRVVDDDPAGPGTRTLVGCGRPLAGHRVLVVDPATRTVLPPDRVGEIWVAGPCVAAGYWGRPAQSAETFGARLADGDGPFLRTGDHGFLHAGEVFVTGRLKDMLVIRGRNHYPEDLEATIAPSHPALRPSGGAVFGVDDDGAEAVVVVHEVQAGVSGPDAVIAAIRRAVAEHHALQLHAVALIAPGTLPKTSSGKVQRFEARAAFLAGTLDPIAVWTAARPAPPADAAAAETGP